MRPCVCSDNQGERACCLIQECSPVWARWAFAMILVVQAFLSLFIIRNILP